VSDLECVRPPAGELGYTYGARGLGLPRLGFPPLQFSFNPLIPVSCYCKLASVTACDLSRSGRSRSRPGFSSVPAAARPLPLLASAHLDWVLLLTFLALILLGTLLSGRDPCSGSHTYVVKQLVNIVIGIALMALVAC